MKSGAPYADRPAGPLPAGFAPAADELSVAPSWVRGAASGSTADQDNEKAQGPTFVGRFE